MECIYCGLIQVSDVCLQCSTEMDRCLETDITKETEEEESRDE